MNYPLIATVSSPHGSGTYCTITGLASSPHELNGVTLDKIYLTEYLEFWKLNDPDIDLDIDIDDIGGDNNFGEFVRPSMDFRLVELLELADVGSLNLAETVVSVSVRPVQGVYHVYMTFIQTNESEILVGRWHRLDHAISIASLLTTKSHLDAFDFEVEAVAV